MSSLSLIPNRTVIVDANGCATPEFIRALQSLTVRVGGSTGDGVEEVFAQPASFSQGGYSAETYQLAGQGGNDAGPEVFQPLGQGGNDAGPEVFQPLSMSYELSLKEDKINKGASGGYVGLTLFSINFPNADNTFTSLLENTNTAVRTYTFPDRSLTVAGTDDITGGLQAANFTAYSASGTAGITATITLASTTSITVKNGIVTGYA